MVLEFLFDLAYFIRKCGNQRTFPLSVAEYLLLKIKNILNNWVLKSQEKIMYCIFKMDKHPIGASFITAFKICSTKQTSKSVFNILSPKTPKLKIFIKMLHFLHTKKLCVTKCWPHHSFINNTNEKSVPNLLQHMTFRHYKLESKLSSNVNFAFKAGNNRLSIIVQDTGRGKAKWDVIGCRGWGG